MSQTITFGEILDVLQRLKNLEAQDIPKEEIILRVFNNNGVMCFVSGRNRLYRFKSRYHQGRTLKQIPGARLQTDVVRIIVIGETILLEYGSSQFSQRIAIPCGQVCEVYTNFRYRFKKAVVGVRHKLMVLS